MSPRVTPGTQCDQIRRIVVPESASEADVMNLQLRGTSALLTYPAVSFQHLPSKLPVGLAPEFDSRTLLPDLAQNFGRWVNLGATWAQTPLFCAEIRSSRSVRPTDSTGLSELAIGSIPIARSIIPRSSPDTWVTQRT